MQPIWNHISNQRQVANTILDMVAPYVADRVDFKSYAPVPYKSFAAPGMPRKPDFRIYLFVGVLLGAIGGVLIGLKIGGVNGIITSGSLSLGLIVCLALIYVKRKNDAIVDVTKKYSPEEIGSVLYYYYYCPTIINNLGLEAIRLLVQTFFNGHRNEELIEEIFSTSNSEIAGNSYDGNNWKGSKAQTICRDIFGIDEKEKPKRILYRLCVFKSLQSQSVREIFSLLVDFPQEFQRFIDRLALPQLIDLIPLFLPRDTVGFLPILTNTKTRFCQAIYYTTNPNVEGDTSLQYSAKVSQLISQSPFLPSPLKGIVLGYYAPTLGEIVPGTKVAKIAHELMNLKFESTSFELYMVHVNSSPLFRFPDILRAAFEDCNRLPERT